MHTAFFHIMEMHYALNVRSLKSSHHKNQIDKQHYMTEEECTFLIATIISFCKTHLMDFPFYFPSLSIIYFPFVSAPGYSFMFNSFCYFSSSCLQRDTVSLFSLFFSFPVITMHLNISTTGNFSEVLLLLQGLVHLVVCHAETTQTGFNGVQRLCEYDKLGHVWNADDLSVQLRGKADRLLNLSAVYQPESTNIETFGQLLKDNQRYRRCTLCIALCKYS